MDLGQNIASKGIDELKIDGYEAMDVTLKATDSEEISLKLKGKGRRYLGNGEAFSDWLEVKVSNGILKISPAVSEDSVDFSDIFKGNGGLDLTVMFPKKQKFNDVQILTISGDIEMKKLFAKNIALKSVSGDIDFDKVNCRKLTVEAVSSDIDLSSIIASKVEIKTVSGDATISSKTELPRYTFNSVSGNLDLKLPKSALVDVNFKSMTGELINQFTKKSETAGSIEVSSMSGDAQITKIQ